VFTSKKVKGKSKKWGTDLNFLLFTFALNNSALKIFLEKE